MRRQAASGQRARPLANCGRNMAFLVEVTDKALTDAEEYFKHLLANSNDAETANVWARGLDNTFASLESMPERCARVREPEFANLQLRQILYHSHRIVFDIRKRDRIVRVLRIYHSSRKPFKI